MKDVHSSIEDYNLGKELKVLFGDRIADMINNKKNHPVVTKLFIRDWKPNTKGCKTKHHIFSS